MIDWNSLILGLLLGVVLGVTLATIDAYRTALHQSRCTTASTSTAPPSNTRSADDAPKDGE